MRNFEEASFFTKILITAHLHHLIALKGTNKYFISPNLTQNSYKFKYYYLLIKSFQTAHYNVYNIIHFKTSEINEGKSLFQPFP